MGQKGRYQVPEHILLSMSRALFMLLHLMQYNLSNFNKIVHSKAPPFVNFLAFISKIRCDVCSTKLRTTNKQKKKRTVNILVNIPLDFSKHLCACIYFHKHELTLCADRSVICCSHVTHTWGHMSLETFKVLLPQLTSELPNELEEHSFDDSRFCFIEISFFQDSPSLPLTLGPAFLLLFASIPSLYFSLLLHQPRF